MTELEKAARLALEAITQYLSESPDPSEEAVEGLCDARAALNKTLRRALEQDPDLRDKDPELVEQPAQKRPQNCGTGYCSCIECLFEPEQPAQQDIEELTAQRDQLADILTRTANALKGQPAELSAHSWHDLPEVAQQLKAAQQEPVAWMDRDGDVYRNEPPANWCPPHYPLYTRPARKWVGLTDDEVKRQWEVWRANAPRYVGFAKGIEQLLKEKNT